METVKLGEGLLVSKQLTREDFDAMVAAGVKTLVCLRPDDEEGEYLTSHEAESFVRQALQSGAAGYISKDSDPAELIVGIQAVHRGDPYLSPKVAAGLVSGVKQGAIGKETVTTRLASLTPREREVFQLLALGKSNKEVASELDISLGTAKKHRENLQRKLDCHSAAELERFAIREGLLE